MFDEIKKLIKDLQKKAAETGETQTATISSNGWQPTKDGKGMYRFEGMTITVEPAKKSGGGARERAAEAVLDMEQK